MESVAKIWKKKHNFFSCSPCAGLRHTTNTTLCRVPRFRHTAKGQVCRVSPWTHGKGWRPSLGLTAATASSCAWQLAHGEKRALPCAPDGRIRHRTVCTRAMHVLRLRRVSEGWHTTKVVVCHVSDFGTRQKLELAVCFLFVVCFFETAYRVITGKKRRNEI